MENRYIIFEGSITGHHRFKFSIIDTSKGKDTKGQWMDFVCECFEKEDAQLVCNSLNLHVKKEENSEPKTINNEHTFPKDYSFS